MIGVGVTNVNSLLYLGLAHDVSIQEAGESAGAKGAYGVKHDKPAASRPQRVLRDDLPDGEGDGDGRRRCHTVALGDVFVGVRGGSISIFIVQGRVIGLVYPLPEDGIEGSR